MNAVVTYGPHDSRYEKVKVPRAGENEVLLKVEGCGICAGDIKAYKGGEVFWGDGVSPPYLTVPAIGGHEFVGAVVEIGDAAAEKNNLRIGDRVAVEQIAPCGKCRYCLNGQYTYCRQHDVFGFKNHLNGGFAEYALMPETARLYKIPSDLELTEAVLIEPYACSWHAVDRALIKPSDVLAISGCGPLGLGMVAAAKLRNPSKIITIDLFDERLELSRAFGSDVAINASRQNVAEEILKMTDGYGCDAYIEATGHTSSVTQGLEAICKNGRFVEFSLFNEPVTCNWSVIGDAKELDLYGACLSPDCFPPVIEAIADGRLKTNGVVTHKFPLDKFLEAFETCMDGRNNIKVIFEL